MFSRKINITIFFTTILLLITSCSADSNQLDGDLDQDFDVLDGDADISESDEVEQESIEEDVEKEIPDCPNEDPCVAGLYNAQTEQCDSHAFCSDANKNICIVENDNARCLCNEGFGIDGNGNCMQTQIAGTTCNDAILLAPNTDFHGFSAGAQDNTSGSCAIRDGIEVIHYFYVDETIEAEFTSSGYDTVMYLRSVCSDADSEIACNDNDEDRNGSHINVELEQGWYFLFVDSYLASGNRYYLESSFSCPADKTFDTLKGKCLVDPCLSDPCTDKYKSRCKRISDTEYECSCTAGLVEDNNACIADFSSTGESCLSPVFLEETEGTITGTTTTALPDERPNCVEDMPTAGDLVYMFEITETSMMQITYTGGEGLIYIRQNCEDSDTEVMCNNCAKGNVLYQSSILEEGLYYLIVDSYHIGDDFELEYTIRTDPCLEIECAGETFCQQSQDWSAYECTCEEGYNEDNSKCVDDPCIPNPCNGLEHKNTCQPVFGETIGTFCVCDYGYIENNGTCIADPDANEWGFFVYLNADNNLEDNGYIDLEEMVLAGSTKDVHIVVLFDSYDEDEGAGRKIYITKEGVEVIENLGEIDMGHWQTLADFGVWAMDTYPARKNALIMWDHGNGWMKSSTGETPPFKDFSEDSHGSSSGILISNGEFSKALEQITDAHGSKIDIVGFDACYMGMLEIAIASADYADIFIASQETIPNDGWSYHDILRPLVANPQKSAEDLAFEIVDSYYLESDQNSTLSALDLTKMDSLLIELSAFADLMTINSEHYQTFELHRNLSQDVYRYDTYKDLKDFVTKVKEDITLPSSLKTSAANLEAALNEFIIYNKNQSSHPNANGVNIYFPKYDTWAHPNYFLDESPWRDRFKWDEFLLDFAGLPDLNK